MKIRKLVINMHFRCFENFDLGKLSFFVWSERIT